MLQDDMLNTRDLPSLWFDADLYAVGSPCQPWSVAGLRDGGQCDKGTLLAAIPYQVEKHKPKSFLVENVLGLLQLFPESFNWLVDGLRGISLPNGTPCYSSSVEVFALLFCT